MTNEYGQIPYKPDNITVRTSTAAFVTPESPGEVPDRLDVSWSRPSLDATTQLFETSDGGKIMNNFKNDVVPAAEGQEASARGALKEN